MSSDQSDDLTVLMLPDYTATNPYQRKLRSGLETVGASVVITDSIGYFAVLSAVRTHGVPDVVHLHWLHSFVIGDNPGKTALGGIRLLCELLLLKLLGVTIVWTVHNVFEHRRRAPRAETVIKHLITRLSDRVIVHCSAARETVVSAYHLPDKTAKKCTVVPHGHYIGSYPNEESQSSARRTLNIDPEEIVFLYFGQIRPYKNIPLLVKTFKRLDQPDARLLIVGNPWDEGEAQTVRRLARSDLRIRTIFEFVPDEEIQLYMNAADVVVLPFEKILSSGSTLLAMSFAKAVIAPRSGCIGELLDPDGGFAYDPEQESGLANAMEQALNADLDAMGEYNYRKAKQYDWSGIAENTLAVYRGPRSEP